MSHEVELTCHRRPAAHWSIFAAFLLLANASVIATGQPAPPVQGEQAKPPFTITISYNRQNPNLETVSDAVATAGAWVGFRVKKTNISDHEIIKLSIAPGAAGYLYDVRDANGNPVAFKKRNDLIDGKVMFTSGEDRIIGSKDMLLQPGESKITFPPLSNDYELDKPGTYTIQVSEHVSDDPASEVVKSNILRITVVTAVP